MAAYSTTVHDVPVKTACPRCGEELQLLLMVRPVLTVKAGRSFVMGDLSGQRIVDHDCKE